MLGLIIAILLVCGFCYIFGFRIVGLVKGRQEDKNKPKPMKDYIIFFKNEENNKVLTHQILKEIGLSVWFALYECCAIWTQTEELFCKGNHGDSEKACILTHAFSL